VIRSDPHSGRGLPPSASNTQPGFGKVRGASAPMLGPKPSSPSTIQPWLRPVRATCSAYQNGHLVAMVATKYAFKSLTSKTAWKKKQIIIIRMHLPVTYTFRQPWSLYSTHKKPHQVANQEIRHFARPKAAQVGLMPQKTSSSFWHYSAHRNILYSNTAGPHTTVARF